MTLQRSFPILLSLPVGFVAGFFSKAPGPCCWKIPVSFSIPIKVEPSFSSEDPSSPLELKVQFIDGLPNGSSRSPNQIRFLEGRPQLTLALRNRTPNPIHLWRPYCPQGDEAFVIEFKGSDHGEARTSRPTFSYTGGMGRPKTVTLAPGELMLQPLDFATEWSFPLPVKPGESRKMMVRISYRSAPTNHLPEKPGAAQVWQGNISTPWLAVMAHNLTEREIR